MESDVGTPFSGRVSKLSLRFRGLEGGGRGGRGLRFLAVSGLEEGERKGEEASDGTAPGMGSTFSLGIRGGRCLWPEDGARVSVGIDLAPRFESVFMAIEPGKGRDGARETLERERNGDRDRSERVRDCCSRWGKRGMRFEIDEGIKVISLSRRIICTYKGNLVI